MFSSPPDTRHSYCHVRLNWIRVRWSTLRVMSYKTFLIVWEILIIIHSLYSQIRKCIQLVSTYTIIKISIMWEIGVYNQWPIKERKRQKKTLVIILIVCHSWKIQFRHKMLKWIRWWLLEQEGTEPHFISYERNLCKLYILNTVNLLLSTMK